MLGLLPVQGTLQVARGCHVGLNRASGVEVIILHHANVAIITMVSSVQTTRELGGGDDDDNDRS